jgi:hypothetical protein
MQLHKVAFKLINSTTILLPAWHEALHSSKMSVMLMPCDVATRWNLTFEMLNYAVEHRKAVDIVTQRQDLGLREFELSDEEWDIAGQLRDVLRVRLFLAPHCR